MRRDLGRGETPRTAAETPLLGTSRSIGARSRGVNPRTSFDAESTSR
jgi:hypothetical protein